MLYTYYKYHKNCRIQDALMSDNFEDIKTFMKDLIALIIKEIYEKNYIKLTIYLRRRVWWYATSRYGKKEGGTK